MLTMLLQKQEIRSRRADRFLSYSGSGRNHLLDWIPTLETALGLTTNWCLDALF